MTWFESVNEIQKRMLTGSKLLLQISYEIQKSSPELQIVVYDSP